MALGPVNAIMGEDYGTELPLTEVPEQDLSAERKAAKFSKTVEFKRLKEHFEQRIEYYQAFLPNGEAVLNKSAQELAQEWKVANAVVAELKMVISFYERANEVVADAARRENS